MKDALQMATELRETMLDWLGKPFTDINLREVWLDMYDIIQLAHDEGQAILCKACCGNAERCPVEDEDGDAGIGARVACIRNGGFDN